MSAADRTAMKDEGRRFVTFVGTGGAAAVVNVGVRALLSRFLIFEIAVVAAYVVAMTVAFVLARVFVFNSRSSAWAAEYGRFAIVNLFAFLQVLIVSSGLLRLVFPAIGFTWRAETVAHIIGVASPVVTSYYAHKRFSFGRRREDAGAGGE